MEYTHIIALFRKYIRTFWVTVAVCVALGALWQITQPNFVASNLTLNVTRLGSDKTTDYQYHDFYRLQADERFADTVVRWLQAPRIVVDIYAQVPDKAASSTVPPHTFKAERLSSQMIQVTYTARDTASAQNIAQAVVQCLNEEAGVLNKDQQESSWFVIVGDAPIVTDARVSLIAVVVAAFALGMFLGFWAVLWRHYFAKV